MSNLKNTPEQEDPRLPLSRRNYLLLVIGLALYCWDFFLWPAVAVILPTNLTTRCFHGDALL